MKRFLAPAAALLALFGSSGCYVRPQTAVGLARLAIFTAAVAGQVMILSAHDAHYHSPECGHYRRWYGGRWVYYYEDRWEYYDDGGARWYYYVD